MSNFKARCTEGAEHRAAVILIISLDNLVDLFLRSIRKLQGTQKKFAFLVKYRPQQTMKRIASELQAALSMPV